MFGLENKNQNEKIESYVGVDIGTSAIKVVQVRRDRDQVHLETYARLEMAAYNSLPPGSVTSLGEQKTIKALHDLFSVAKITSSNIIFGIPISSCFISSINMPKVSDEELKSLIPIEARKYLPIPVSEVKINYWRTDVNPRSDNKENTVIIAAVKNETLEMYERLAKELHLDNKKIFFEIESLAGARVISRGLSQTEAFLYVDIGGSITGVSFIFEGILKGTNVIQHGSFETTLQVSNVLGLGFDVAEQTKRLFGYFGDASSPFLSEVIELSSYPLFDEISHLSLKYERMYNININKIFLAGGGSLVKGIKEFALDFLKKEIFIADSFKDLTLPENFKKAALNLDQEYAIATGLALKNIL